MSLVFDTAVLSDTFPAFQLLKIRHMDDGQTRGSFLHHEYASKLGVSGVSLV
jgi:hypothetical protein